MKKNILRSVVFCMILLGSEHIYAEPIVTIFSFNDIYSINGVEDRGGLARLKTMLEQEKLTAKNSIVTVNGDFLGPSFASLTTKGRHIVDLFDYIGVDYVVVGNHEFDFGTKELLKTIRKSKFKWFASNVFHHGKLMAGTKEFEIISVAGKKIGIFGVCTPDVKNLSNPGPDVHFSPPIKESQKIVDKLKKNDVDIIIALTHQTLDEDLELARQIAGIDLILGGHDHYPATLLRYGTLIHKSGHDANFLVRIDLDMVTKNDKVEFIPTWKMIPITEQITEENIVAEKIAVALSDKHINYLSKEVMFGNDFDMRQDVVRSKENSLGNLIADFIRFDLKADCAFINAGFLRGDAFYKKGQKIVLSEFIKAVPFTDEVLLIEVTGAQIKEVLEYTLSKAPKDSKTFPQLSGINIKYDSTKPVGDRISEVLINGKLLVNNDRYRLATLDFLYHGGDGFACLNKGSLLSTEAKQSGPLGLQVAKFIAADGKIIKKLESRIIDTAPNN